jgi:hypothetical protein
MSELSSRSVNVPLLNLSNPSRSRQRDVTVAGSPPSLLDKCISAAQIHVKPMLLMLLFILIVFYGAAFYSFSRARSNYSAHLLDAAVPPVCGVGAALGRQGAATRGSIAMLYSGSVRAFPLTFPSHLLNIIAPSPFEVHAFMAVNSMLTADQLPEGYSVEDAFAFADSLRNNISDAWPPQQHPLVQADDGLRQLFATLRYWTHYTDLDGGRHSTFSLIKGFSLSYQGLLPLWEEELFHSLPTSALNPKGTWMASLSEARSARLKLEYQKQHGTAYQWTMRLRFDVLHSLNIWEQLFEITPVQQVARDIADSPPRPFQLASGDLSSCRDLPEGTYFLIHDQLYRPALLNSDRRVYTVNGQQWGGINDQWLIGSDEGMTLYSLRAQTWPYYPPENLHPETNSREALLSHHIPYTELPSCYGLARQSPACEINEAHNLRVTLVHRTCGPICSRSVFSSSYRTHVDPDIVWQGVRGEDRLSAISLQRSLERELWRVKRVIRADMSELIASDRPVPSTLHAAAAESFLAEAAEISSSSDLLDIPQARNQLENLLLGLYLVRTNEAVADVMALQGTSTQPFPKLRTSSSNFYYYFRYRFPELHDQPCIWQPIWLAHCKIDLIGWTHMPFMEHSMDVERTWAFVHAAGQCMRKDRTVG